MHYNAPLNYSEQFALIIIIPCFITIFFELSQWLSFKNSGEIFEKSQPCLSQRSRKIHKGGESLKLQSCNLASFTA